MRLWWSPNGLQVGEHLLHERTRMLGKDGRDRLELKLALAFRHRLPRDIVETVIKAAGFAARGDLTLANIRLALTVRADLPEADDLDARCALADHLLARGMTADALMSELGYGRAERGLDKYDDDQPRVPAGSGRTSGQWTRGDGAGAATLATAGVAALAAGGDSLMVSGLSAAAITALGALAASVGFGAALGLLFVPSPNSTSTGGQLPDNPGRSYAYDSDTGLLRIMGADGVLLAGHADAEGIFRDAATDLPFARMVGGSLVMDSAAIEAADSDADAEPVPRVDVGVDAEERDKPRLCPDPGPDQPSGRPSKRAIAYQEQISRLISPERPLEYGLAMNLLNPQTGALVHFDECDENDGTMFDAKGPGYAGLLAFSTAEENVRDDWIDQATRQLQAASPRRVVWYFAEQEAANYARNLFARTELNVEVRFEPPVIQ